MTPKDQARQLKLNALQEEHRVLSAEKRSLKKRATKLTNEIAEINTKLGRLGAQILDMKNEDGDTPHITDHAVVRYMERVKKIDIWKIKSEIIAHRNAVRVENTIVTVAPDKKCECIENRYVWHTVDCPDSPEKPTGLGV